MPLSELASTSPSDSVRFAPFCVCSQVRLAERRGMFKETHHQAVSVLYEHCGVRLPNHTELGGAAHHTPGLYGLACCF